MCEKIKQTKRPYLEDVRALVVNLTKKGKAIEVKQALHEYGAECVSDLKEDEYNGFYQSLLLIQ